MNCQTKKLQTDSGHHSKTEQFDRMHVTVALNYSSKNELVDAVKEMLRDAQLGKLNPTSLEYSDIASYLYTKELPDPDLIIRTSENFASVIFFSYNRLMLKFM